MVDLGRNHPLSSPAAGGLVSLCYMRCNVDMIHALKLGTGGVLVWSHPAPVREWTYNRDYMVTC